MKLKALIGRIPGKVNVIGDIEGVEVLKLCTDSRKVTEGGLFFCTPGLRMDAHDFAPQAVERGACALVVERRLDVNVPQIQVEDVRIAASYIAADFYGNPAEKMTMLGITGTKGKTTTTYMLKAILEAAGHKCGLIGTTGNLIGGQLIPGSHTTPDPIDLQRTLRLMADAGVEYVPMEVSAHAIDMYRLDGLTFEVGCYTNLSQDHLDYFHTMENYFETKKRFFTQGMVRNACVNVDEETTAQLQADLNVPRLTYGICAAADLYARDIEITEEGVNFELQLQGMHHMPINLPMTGMFNVYNAMAAASCAMVLGISAENIKAGLEGMSSVPGRIEMLPTGTPYRVILDYSHVPDALMNILTTVRQFAKGRVIAVFGCGGDRDQGKRPMMGEIAGKLADFSILTSDNPRTEDPMKILAAIEAGIKPTGGQYVVIENRREAIRYAMKHGEKGDIIVLAGKGHETYQEINGVKHPFDEKVVVQELLEEMHDRD